MALVLPIVNYLSRFVQAAVSATALSSNQFAALGDMNHYVLTHVACACALVLHVVNVDMCQLVTLAILCARAYVQVTRAVSAVVLRDIEVAIRLVVMAVQNHCVLDVVLSQRMCQAACVSARHRRLTKGRTSLV